MQTTRRWALACFAAAAVMGAKAQDTNTLAESDTTQSTAIATDATQGAMQIRRGRQRTKSKHPGIDRIRTYDVTSPDIPAAFEGYRMVFVTDTHYPSLFTDKTLESLGTVLKELRPDAILLGGDYQEDCQHVEPLFRTIAECNPGDGIYGVLGNNDLERCTDIIKSLMKDYGIALVEDTAMQISRLGSHVTIAGVHNTFQRHETAPSPTLSLPANDFVILLTHTPDYAEDQDITNADLTLAGHTHGGQVTLLGAWAPVTASHYGQRFLKGLNWNSAGQPVITSTGIGTSRRNVRLFAPSEVILLTLHSQREPSQYISTVIEGDDNEAVNAQRKAHKTVMGNDEDDKNVILALPSKD